MAQRRGTAQGRRGGSASSGSGGSSRTRSASSGRKAAGNRAGKADRQGARSESSAAAPPEPERAVTAKTAAELRDLLMGSLVRPLDLLMLTRDRIEEVVGEAVERGRMTADDAADLAARLVQRGRKQTNDVLRDLEDLLGRGVDEIEGGASAARERGSEAAGRARRRVEEAPRGALRATDPALAQADPVRRAAGLGPSFPIAGYDDLTAAQVQSQLGTLTTAELRKVRDYERRHANRKTVLSAIEQRLGR
jgi:polyhydroxyalkanoate synthesis regulator phasin